MDLISRLSPSIHEHLRIAVDAAEIALWSWNVDTDEVVMDERAYALWDVPVGTDVTFELLSARIHPADLGKVGEILNATRSLVGRYDVDFRILIGKDEKWISARGQGSDAGIVDSVLCGIFMDVTDRKRADETRELLAHEMSHRLKNLLAITSALATISARSTCDTAAMAIDLVQRLQGLGSAHDLVVPDPGGIRQPVLLSRLLGVLLAPYDERHQAGRRITVHGPDVGAGETSVNALALIAHELATNSIKYGALSRPGGTLDVSYRLIETEIVIVWVEQGGPPMVASRRHDGFGTRLIARVSNQLGGSIAYDWRMNGLSATLRVDRDHLAR